MLIADILDQMAELLRVGHHLFPLLLRDLEEGQHDLQVEVEALPLEEVRELLLTGQKDEYLE